VRSRVFPRWGGGALIIKKPPPTEKYGGKVRKIRAKQKGRRKMIGRLKVFGLKKCLLLFVALSSIPLFCLGSVFVIDAISFPSSATIIEWGGLYPPPLDQDIKYERYDPDSGNGGSYYYSAKKQWNYNGTYYFAAGSGPVYSIYYKQNAQDNIDSGKGVIDSAYYAKTNLEIIITLFPQYKDTFGCFIYYTDDNKYNGSYFDMGNSYGSWMASSPSAYKGEYGYKMESGKLYKRTINTHAFWGQAGKSDGGGKDLCYPQLLKGIQIWGVEEGSNVNLQLGAGLKFKSPLTISGGVPSISLNPFTSTTTSTTVDSTANIKVFRKPAGYDTEWSSVKSTRNYDSDTIYNFAGVLSPESFDIIRVEISGIIIESGYEPAIRGKTEISFNEVYPRETQTLPKSYTWLNTTVNDAPRLVSMVGGSVDNAPDTQTIRQYGENDYTYGLGDYTRSSNYLLEPFNYKNKSYATISYATPTFSIKTDSTDSSQNREASIVMEFTMPNQEYIFANPDDDMDILKFKWENLVFSVSGMVGDLARPVVPVKIKSNSIMTGTNSFTDAGGNVTTWRHDSYPFMQSTSSISENAQRDGSPAAWSGIDRSPKRTYRSGNAMVMFSGGQHKTGTIPAADISDIAEEVKWQFVNISPTAWSSGNFLYIYVKGSKIGDLTGANLMGGVVGYTFNPYPTLVGGGTTIGNTRYKKIEMRATTEILSGMNWTAGENVQIFSCELTDKTFNFAVLENLFYTESTLSTISYRSTRVGTDTTITFKLEGTCFQDGLLASSGQQNGMDSTPVSNPKAAQWFTLKDSAGGNIASENYSFTAKSGNVILTLKAPVTTKWVDITIDAKPNEYKISAPMVSTADRMQYTLTHQNKRGDTEPVGKFVGQWVFNNKYAITRNGENGGATLDALEHGVSVINGDTITDALIVKFGLSRLGIGFTTGENGRIESTYSLGEIRGAGNTPKGDGMTVDTRALRWRHTGLTGTAMNPSAEYDSNDYEDGGDIRNYGYVFALELADGYKAQQPDIYYRRSLTAGWELLRSVHVDVPASATVGQVPAASYVIYFVPFVEEGFVASQINTYLGGGEETDPTKVANVNDSNYQRARYFIGSGAVNTDPVKVESKVENVDRVNLIAGDDSDEDFGTPVDLETFLVDTELGANVFGEGHKYIFMIFVDDNNNGDHDQGEQVLDVEIKNIGGKLYLVLKKDGEGNPQTVDYGSKLVIVAFLGEDGDSVATAIDLFYTGVLGAVKKADIGAGDSATQGYGQGNPTRKWYINRVTSDIVLFEFQFGKQQQISLSFQFVDATFNQPLNFTPGMGGVYNANYVINVNTITSVELLKADIVTDGNSTVRANYEDGLPRVSENGITDPLTGEEIEIGQLNPNAKYIFNKKKVKLDETLTLAFTGNGAFPLEVQDTKDFARVGAAYKFIGWVVGTNLTQNQPRVSDLNTDYGSVTNVTAQSISFSFKSDDEMVRQFKAANTLKMYCVLAKKEMVVNTVDYVVDFGEIGASGVETPSQFDPKYVGPAGGNPADPDTVYRLGESLSLPGGAEYDNAGYTFAGWYFQGATYRAIENKAKTVAELIQTGDLTLIDLNDSYVQTINRTSILKLGGNLGNLESFKIVALWVRNNVNISFDLTGDMKNPSTRNKSIDDVTNFPDGFTKKYGEDVSYTDLCGGAMGSAPEITGYEFNGFYYTNQMRGDFEITSDDERRLGSGNITDGGVDYVKAANSVYELGYPTTGFDYNNTVIGARMDATFPFGIQSTTGLQAYLLDTTGDGFAPEEYNLEMYLNFIAETHNIKYYQDSTQGREIGFDQEDEDDAFFAKPAMVCPNYEYQSYWTIPFNGDYPIQRAPAVLTTPIELYKIQVPEPTRGGWVFLGWKLVSNLTVDGADVLTQDAFGDWYLRSDYWGTEIALYAEWRPVTVSIEFSTVSLKSGISMEDNGPDSTGDITGVSGKSFTVTWAVNDPISFMTQTGTAYTVDQTTGKQTTTIDKAQAFFREGYTLVGWRAFVPGADSMVMNPDGTPLVDENGNVTAIPMFEWRGKRIGVDAYGRAQFVECDSLDELFGTDGYTFSTYSGKELYRTLGLQSRLDILDGSRFAFFPIWERNILSIVYSDSIDGSGEPDQKIEVVLTQGQISGVAVGGAAISATDITTDAYYTQSGELKQRVIQFTYDGDKAWNESVDKIDVQGTIRYNELITDYNATRDGYYKRGYYIARQELTLNENVANDNVAVTYGQKESAIWLDAELSPAPVPGTQWTKLVAGYPEALNDGSLVFDELRVGSVKLVVIPIWEPYTYMMQVRDFNVAGTENNTHVELNRATPYKYDAAGYTVSINDLLNEKAKRNIMNFDGFFWSYDPATPVDASMLQYHVGATELFGNEGFDTNLNMNVYVGPSVVNAEYAGNVLSAFTVRQYNTSATDWEEVRYTADNELTITFVGTRLTPYLYARYNMQPTNEITNIYAKFSQQSYTITLKQMWSDTSSTNALTDRGEYLGELKPLSGFEYEDTMSGDTVVARTVTTKHTYGHTTSIPEAVAPAGFRFDGWEYLTGSTFETTKLTPVSTGAWEYDNGALTGNYIYTTTLPATLFTSNITLYARFVEVGNNGKPKTYTVNLNLGVLAGNSSDISGAILSESGKAYNASEYTAGKDFDGLTVGGAISGDYEFTGWVKADGNTVIADTNMGQNPYSVTLDDFLVDTDHELASITLVARWRMRALRVEYKYMDGQCNAVSTIYDFDKTANAWTNEDGYGYRLRDYVPETNGATPVWHAGQTPDSVVDARINPTSPITKAQAADGYYIGGSTLLGNIGLGDASAFFNTYRFVGWQKDTTNDYLNYGRSEVMTDDMVFNGIFKVDVRPLMYALDRLDRLDTREPWEDGFASSWTVAVRDSYNELRTDIRTLAEKLMFEETLDLPYDDTTRESDKSSMLALMTRISTFLETQGITITDADLYAPKATNAANGKGYNPLNTAYLNALIDLLGEYNAGINAGIVNPADKNWKYQSDLYDTATIAGAVSGGIEGSQLVKAIADLLHAQTEQKLSAVALEYNTSATEPSMRERVSVNYQLWTDVVEMENRVRSLLEALGAFDTNDLPIHLVAAHDMLLNAYKYIRIMLEYAGSRTDRDGIEFANQSVYDQLFTLDGGLVNKYRAEITHKDASDKYDIKMVRVIEIIRDLDILREDLGLGTNFDIDRVVPNIVKNNQYRSPILYPVSHYADRDTVIDTFELIHLLQEHRASVTAAGAYDMCVFDREYLVEPDSRSLTVENIWELKYGNLNITGCQLFVSIVSVSQALRTVAPSGVTFTEVENDENENPSFGLNYDFEMQLPNSKAAYVSVTPAVLSRLGNVITVVKKYLLDQSIESDEYASTLLGTDNDGNPIREGGALVTWLLEAETQYAAAVANADTYTNADTRLLLNTLNKTMHGFMTDMGRGKIDTNTWQPTAGDAVPEGLSEYDIAYLYTLYWRLYSFSSNGNASQNVIIPDFRRDGENSLGNEYLSHNDLLERMRAMDATLTQIYKQEADPSRIFPNPVTSGMIWEHITWVEGYIRAENVEQLEWNNGETVTFRNKQYFFPLPSGINTISKEKMDRLWYYIQLMEEVRDGAPTREAFNEMYDAGDYYFDWGYFNYGGYGPASSIVGQLNESEQGNGRAWELWLHPISGDEYELAVDAQIEEIIEYLRQLGYTPRDVRGLYKHLDLCYKLLKEYQQTDDADKSDLGNYSLQIRSINTMQLETYNILAKGINGVTYKEVKNQINKVIALMDALGEQNVVYFGAEEKTDFAENGFRAEKYLENGVYEYDGVYEFDTFKYVMAFGGYDYQWDKLDLLLFRVGETLKTMDDGRTKAGFAELYLYGLDILENAKENPYPDSSVLEMWLIRQEIEKYGVDILQIERPTPPSPRPEGGRDKTSSIMPIVIAGISILGLLLLLYLAYRFVIKPNLKKRQELAHSKL
jgi:hypothetical protein